MDRELSFKATTGETIRVKWGAAEDPTDQDLTDIEQAWYSSHPRPKAQTQNAAPRPLQGSLGAPVPVDPFRDGMKVQKPAQGNQPPKPIPAGFGVIGGRDLIPEARDKKPAPRAEIPKGEKPGVKGPILPSWRRQFEDQKRRDQANAPSYRAMTDAEAEKMPRRGKGESESSYQQRLKQSIETADAGNRTVAEQLAHLIGSGLDPEAMTATNERMGGLGSLLLGPLAGLSDLRLLNESEKRQLSPAQKFGASLNVGLTMAPGLTHAAGEGVVGALKSAPAKKLAGAVAQGFDQATKSRADRRLEGHVATALRQALGEDVPQFDLPAHGDLVSPGEMPGATFRKPTGKAGLTAGQRAAADASPAGHMTTAETLGPDLEASLKSLGIEVPEPRATGQAVPEKGLEPTNVPKAPEPSHKPTPAATGNVAPTAGGSGAKEPWQMRVTDYAQSEVERLHLPIIAQVGPRIDAAQAEWEAIRQLQRNNWDVGHLTNADPAWPIIGGKQMAPSSPEIAARAEKLADEVRSINKTLKDAGIPNQVVVSDDMKMGLNHAKFGAIDLPRNAERATKVRLGFEGIPTRPKGSNAWASNMVDTHEAAVTQALKDGKPVPPEVLADYPDLAAKYGKAEPPKPTGPTLSDAVANPTGKAQGVTPESFTRKPLETKAPNANPPKAEPKPTEPMQGPSQATGLANQVQDREALQGILDQVEPTKGKSAEDWQKIGKAKVESGEINPHELAQQIADGDVELTGERVGALLEGKRRLELDVNNAKPGAEYEAAKQRLQDYVEKVQQGKGRWSDVGRALQAGTTLDEGNFAQVIEHARRSGAELNPKQEAEIRRLAEQVKSKDEQLAAAQKIIEDQQASMTAQNVARAARRLKTGDVQKARDAARARFVKASAANTFVNDEQMAAWWDLAKTYVQKGDTPDSLIERIRKDLGDQLPDYITDADMKAAMALGGKPQQAAKRARTEIEKEIAKLRREAKVQTGVRDSELIPQIQKRIADLQDQLDTGQYRLPKARAAMYGPEVEKLQAQRDVLAAQVRAKIRDAATPMWGLKGKVAKEITGGIRGLQLGSDLGVLRRQGLFAWSHPILAAKNVGKAARAMLSDENLAVMERKIMERTNSEGQLLAPIRKKAGLSLTIGPLNQDEEMIVGRLLKRIPGIGTLAGKPLERFQVAWLNGVRADLFDASVAKGFTPEERALRAQFINSVTGRSNLKSVPDAMSVLMTSPRYEASRWETIFAPVKNLAALGKDALTGKGVNRAAVANLKDMAVTAGTVLATYKAAELAGYKVNWDPESSDFLKMRKGDEVWDVSAGLAPRLRDIARLYIAATHPGYKHNMGDVIRGMAVRTISPAVRMPVQWGSHQTQSAAGETAVKDPFTGFPADKYEQGWRLLTPLIVRSIEQAWDQPGDTPTKLKTAASAGAREFVGDSVNRYPAKK